PTSSEIYGDGSDAASSYRDQEGAALRPMGTCPAPRPDPYFCRVSGLVVVGGGAAGMSAASAARRVDPALPIVVLEATGHAAYGLCGLPYHLSGVVDADGLFSYPPDYFRKKRGIDLRFGAAATG